MDSKGRLRGLMGSSQAAFAPAQIAADREIPARPTLPENHPL
jgi:hypothetical protein